MLAVAAVCVRLAATSSSSSTTLRRLGTRSGWRRCCMRCVADSAMETTTERLQLLQCLLCEVEGGKAPRQDTGQLGLLLTHVACAVLCSVLTFCCALLPLSPPHTITTSQTPYAYDIGGHPVNAATPKRGVVHGRVSVTPSCCH